MNPWTALAHELEELANLTEGFALGDATHQELRVQEARVHRAHAVSLRVANPNALLRAVRALGNLDPDFFAETTPEAMHRVTVSRGWTKTGEIPWPGDPSRVAFETFDHPTALGSDRGGVWEVCVPRDPGTSDYPRRVTDWATALATRHGDVTPAEVLAETSRSP